MKQYIDKASLVEALNMMIKSISRLLDLSENRNRDLDIHLLAEVRAYEDILDFVNALEVKEEGLEKEYKKFISCGKGRSMFETAKHFYELGLKSKGE